MTAWVHHSIASRSWKLLAGLFASCIAAWKLALRILFFGGSSQSCIWCKSFVSAAMAPSLACHGVTEMKISVAPCRSYVGGEVARIHPWPRALRHWLFSLPRTQCQSCKWMACLKPIMLMYIASDKIHNALMHCIYWQMTSVVINQNPMSINSNHTYDCTNQLRTQVATQTNASSSSTHVSWRHTPSDNCGNPPTTPGSGSGTHHDLDLEYDPTIWSNNESHYESEYEYEYE